MFLKIFKYLLPIFCFNILSADIDLDAFNLMISDESIDEIYINGNSNVVQKIKLTIGNENKIKVRSNIYISEDNLRFDECAKLYFTAPETDYEGDFIEYDIILKELPKYIFVNNSTLSGKNLNGENIKLEVKNYSVVVLKGKVTNHVLEIDNTSRYYALNLETKNTEVKFNNLICETSVKIFVSFENCLEITNNSDIKVNLFYESHREIRNWRPIIKSIGFFATARQISDFL